MNEGSLKSRLTKEEVENLKCGFCGKGKSEVAHFVAGLKPDVAICDECTAWAWEIVSGNEVSPEILANAAKRNDPPTA